MGSLVMSDVLVVIALKMMERLRVVGLSKILLLTHRTAFIQRGRKTQLLQYWNVEHRIVQYAESSFHPASVSPRPERAAELH